MSDLPALALECFRLHDDPPPLIGAKSPRAWMDATAQRFAYRCTPMTMANASGWELHAPFSFRAEWDGSDAVEAITITTDASAGAVERLLTSHFGHGVLTFHPGWMFRTPPGWAVWARGAPNFLKDGIMPLEGLIETDWLPFGFTMNWRFTRPGLVKFRKGEPFCFITLAPHGALDAVTPQASDLKDHPELLATYTEWSTSRTDFNSRLRQNEPSAVQERWQRTYVAGADVPPGGHHIVKRRLKAPGDIK